MLLTWILIIFFQESTSTKIVIKATGKWKELEEYYNVTSIQNKGNTIPDKQKEIEEKEKKEHKELTQKKE